MNFSHFPTIYWYNVLITMIENFLRLSGYTALPTHALDEGDEQLISDPYHRESGIETVYERILQVIKIDERRVRYCKLVISHPLDRVGMLRFPLTNFMADIRKLTNSPSQYCGVKNRDFIQNAFPIGGAKVFHLHPTNEYPELQMRFLFATYDDDSILTDQMLQSQFYFRVKRIGFHLNIELERIDDELTKGKVAEVLYPVHDYTLEHVRMPFLGKSVRETLKRHNPGPHFLGNLYKFKQPKQ